jgi:hypothetical protein
VRVFICLFMLFFFCFLSFFFFFFFLVFCLVVFEFIIVIWVMGPLSSFFVFFSYRSGVKFGRRKRCLVFCFLCCKSDFLLL